MRNDFPKQMFLKITGISPQELANLHAKLPDFGLRLLAGQKVQLNESGNPIVYPEVIKMMSSKLDENGMYTVELRIRPLHSCYDFKGEGEKHRDLILWSSGRIWAMLWQVLGGIFPEKEELGVMPE